MWTSKAAGLVLVALRLKIAIEQEQNMPQASIVGRIWPNLVSSVHPGILFQEGDTPDRLGKPDSPSPSLTHLSPLD